MSTTAKESPDGAAIGALISERGIQRVLHFTTNRGLLGILASGQLMSRTLLKADEYLENIYTLNSQYRREAPKYWSYVNLSITEINKRFFDIASQKWWKGSDLFWVTVEIEPSVLTHEGVLFSTTNMGYESVEPEAGVAGLENIFADRVHTGWGKFRQRNPHLARNAPTDGQAEAIYPGSISTNHVVAVYAYSDEHAAIAEAMCSAVGHRDIPINVDPDVFQL